MNSGVNPVRRRRPRPPLSCTECRRRKLRCDRCLPCRQCKKGLRADQCVYHDNVRKRSAAEAACLVGVRKTCLQPPQSMPIPTPSSMTSKVASVTWRRCCCASPGQSTNSGWIVRPLSTRPTRVQSLQTAPSPILRKRETTR